MGSMLERLRQTSQKGELFAPIGQLLDFRVVSVEEGRGVVEIHADERLANPMGTLHGGVLCDIADAAMGLAFASLLDESESFTTLELKINFLKPVGRSVLTASAHVIKKGRSVGMVECDVVDETGHLVARASSTCLVLRGTMAEGR